MRVHVGASVASYFETNNHAGIDSTAIQVDGPMDGPGGIALAVVFVLGSLVWAKFISLIYSISVVVSRPIPNGRT